MSHTFFNKQWQEVQQEISNLMVEECPEEPVKPETDQTVHFQTVATLYVSLFCYCFQEKLLQPIFERRLTLFSIAVRICTT